MKGLVAIAVIEEKILLIRGLKVMLDADLAKLYGVTTKRLNEQVKRNKDRFPADFMFQLTQAEKNEVVAICDRLDKLKFSPALPYAFTEHGAIMAASVLNSKRAADVSIYVVRAFVKLREMIAAHKDIVRKLDSLEKKYDEQFQVVFEAIKQLLTEEEKPKKKIGFIAKEQQALYKKNKKH